MPRLREGAQALFEGIEEFFTEEPGPMNAAPPAPDLPPTVEQVLHLHLLLEKLSVPEQEILWREAVARLRTEGHPHPPPEGETYASFRARLDALGPHAASRVASLGHALTLLHHHDTLGTHATELPVAVVIGPAADHNGAFGTANGFPLLDVLIESGRFHVLYFETAREEGAREALVAAYSGTHRRIHTVVLGGHGTPTALAFGGEDPMSAITMEPEEEFLTPDDLRFGDLGDLHSLLEPEGQLLMWSCSNGAGGERGFNMANGISELAPGRRIYSTPIPSNIRSLTVREDLSLDLAWHNTESYVALYREGDRSIWLPAENKRRHREAQAAQNASLPSSR